MSDKFAMAYAIKKRGKYAKGGKVQEPKPGKPYEYMSLEEQDKALEEGKPLSDFYNPKKMADGGPVPQPVEESAADKFVRGFKKKINGMADGGMASDADWAKFTGAPDSGGGGGGGKGTLSAMGDALSQAGDKAVSAFHRFASMARGGIAKKIRAMSKGGEVFSESDDFLSENMEQTEPEDLTYPDPDHTEDPEDKRKYRLSRVMSGLHAKHFGK